MSTEPGLQETYAPHSICFGCGPANARGLRLSSRPDGDDFVAEWTPEEHHQAFAGVLAGGIVGTLLDCHANWSSAAHLMKRRGAARPPTVVTADYHVTMKRPTPIDKGPVRLRARIVESTDDRVVVDTTIEAGEKLTATCRSTHVAVTEGHPAFGRW